MKVYVITRGEYSDYHICAISLNKEKAHELLKYFDNKYDEAVIEEYDTDECYPLEYPFWEITVYDDGRVYVNEIDMDSCYPWERNINRPFECGCYHEVYVKAKDKEHAKKIGLDLIAKFKAQEADL